MKTLTFFLALVVCILLLTNMFTYDLLKKRIGGMNNSEHLLFVLRKWIDKERRDKDFIKKYFERNKYNKIALYGWGYIGKELAQKLKGYDVVVQYVIDKNAAKIQSDVLLYSYDEKLPKVDIIIVTSVSEFYKTKEILRKKVDCPIIAFEDLL